MMTQINTNTRSQLPDAFISEISIISVICGSDNIRKERYAANGITACGFGWWGLTVFLRERA
jgi:hypothetical protein